VLAASNERWREGLSALLATPMRSGDARTNLTASTEENDTEENGHE
jgi:hypothetical protein